MFMKHTLLSPYYSVFSSYIPFISVCLTSRFLFFPQKFFQTSSAISAEAHSSNFACDFSAFSLQWGLYVVKMIEFKHCLLQKISYKRQEIQDKSTIANRVSVEKKGQIQNLFTVSGKFMAGMIMCQHSIRRKLSQLKYSNMFSSSSRNTMHLFLNAGFV